MNNPRASPLDQRDSPPSGPLNAHAPPVACINDVATKWESPHSTQLPAFGPAEGRPCATTVNRAPDRGSEVGFQLGTSHNSITGLHAAALQLNYVGQENEKRKERVWSEGLRSLVAVRGAVLQHQ